MEGHHRSGSYLDYSVGHTRKKSHYGISISQWFTAYSSQRLDELRHSDTIT